MRTVNVDRIAGNSCGLGWFRGRRRLAHSSNKQGEPPQWLCHRDSIINIIIIHYYLVIHRESKTAHAAFLL